MQRAITFLLCSIGWWTAICQSPDGDWQLSFQCPPCGCDADEIIYEGPGTCTSCNMAYVARLEGPALERKPFVPLRVAILLFAGADIMDVTGPWSVFEHASTNVFTVAKTEDSVRLGRTMQLVPDYTFDNLPDVDVLVLPGGGPAESNQDTVITEWVRQRSSATDYLLSVCSGAFFLARAGLLDGLEATTFAALIPQLAEVAPEAFVRNDVKFTTNGQIFTTAGLSSGIEGAFQVLARHYGQGRAQDVANHMEYDWQPDNGFARSLLADNFIREFQSLATLFSSHYLTSSGDTTSWTYVYRLHPAMAEVSLIDMLAKTLQQDGRWQETEKTPNSLLGLLTKPDLGSAVIAFSHSTVDGRRLLSIRAERQTDKSKNK